MNIEHAREFLTLAQCLNFTEAANDLNMTQPALSKHLAALERELGAKLVDRTRKSIQLTEEGRMFFETCGIIVNQYDKMQRALDEIKAARPLKIGGRFDDADVATLMSMAAMMYRNAHRSSLAFARSDGHDELDALEAGEIDLYIDYANPARLKERKLSFRPFVSNPLVAIVGSDHGLAHRARIEWEDLKNETLVKFVSDKTNPAWEQIEELCRAHGFAPKTRPVSSLNDVEFFSTPLHGSVLIWKRTQKQIGLLLETGQRACVPLASENARITAYLVFRPSDEARLAGLFEAIDEAKSLIETRKRREDAPE